MEEFVRKEDFNNLKQEVEKIKVDIIENTKTLQSIDKKIDVITERLISSDKIDELKLNPIEKRLSKLEDNNSWLWKLCATAIITGIISAIISFK